MFCPFVIIISLFFNLTLLTTHFLLLKEVVQQIHIDIKNLNIY